MKNLITFESFSPDLEEVNKVKSYLKSKFKILEGDVLGDKVKYIVVSDKIIYLSGKLLNKKRAVNKIFLEVNDDLKYKESSIRKGIKDFINE